MVMLAFVVGLLGTGAQALAEDGVSWESILSGKTWQVKNTSDMGSSIEWPATARVTFKPNGVLVLHEGFLSSASLLVHHSTGNPYAVPADAVIRYKVFGDLVIVEVPGRVNAAMRMFFKKGKIVAIGCGDWRIAELTLPGCRNGYPELVTTEKIESRWAGGVCKRVTVTNHGSAFIDWCAPAQVEGSLGDSWGAIHEGNTGCVMFCGDKHNVRLLPGEQTEFGFCSRK